jgi:hypothetical protein
VLEPVEAQARNRWDEAFKEMRENHDDALLVDDSIDLDSDEWEW